MITPLSSALSAVTGSDYQEALSTLKAIIQPLQAPTKSKFAVTAVLKMITPLFSASSAVRN